MSRNRLILIRPMLIICPSCAAAYRVHTASFGEAGRLVRCVRCGDVWLGTESLLVPAVTAPSEADEISLAPGDPVVAELASPDAVPEIEAPPLDGFLPDEAGTTTGEDNLGPSDPVPQESDFSGPPPMRSERCETAPGTPVARRGSAWPAPLQAYVRPWPAQSPAHRGRGERFAVVAALALIALHAALIGWRKQIVKVLPQTASFYAAVRLPVNLRGLAISHVATIAQLDGDAPVLLIEGTLANMSARRLKLPRLRLAARNRAGEELYSWTAEPERSVLSPGETLTFRTRLAAPPPDVRDVAVRFFNREDSAEMQRMAARRTSPGAQPQ